jgi:hypothetical protein
MAREPSFPTDAKIGASPPSAPPAPAAPAAPEAPAAPQPPQETKNAGDSRKTKHIVAGAAIGIGSAAIVAALLYANRSRRNDQQPS